MRSGEFLRQDLGGSISGPVLPSSAQKEISTGAPEVKDWAELIIPRGCITSIDNADLFQFPYIGLKELYFLTSSKVPLVAVCSIWDKDEVDSRSGRGRLGFHPVSDPFIPDFDKAISGIRNLSVEEGKRFIKNAIENIDLQKKGELQSLMFTFQAVPRPSPELRTVLVFGKDFVRHKSKPSPVSFLAIKFFFEGPSDRARML